MYTLLLIVIIINTYIHILSLSIYIYMYIFIYYFKDGRDGEHPVVRRLRLREARAGV